jgi:hypothetical protein
MKKFIYILLLALASSMTVVSCTEEEVAPSTENGGITNSPDKNKG